MKTARKREATDTPQRGKARTKVTSGAEQMRQAANEALQSKCKKIAEGLAARSLDGNVQCVKLLLELAAEQPQASPAETERAGRSLASDWSVEPLWGSELSEGTAETGTGGLEAEVAAG